VRLQVNATTPPGRDWGASRICARVYDKQSDFRLTMQSSAAPGSVGVALAAPLRSLRAAMVMCR
jgi:alpha-D-ribose 1-methylphosphonate 5-triphosphate synthase subunit PhnH